MSDSETNALPQQLRRHPALVAGANAARACLKTTYREHIYVKTIDELDGESFEPLAGIRATIHSDIDTPRPRKENQVFSADYVEYLTGRDRNVVASVELIDGYVPISVNETAFYDALRTGLERRFNECGYTLREDAPDGLRAMSGRSIGNSMLECMFKPLSILDRLDVSPLQVTTSIENGCIVLRTPVDRLFEKRPFNWGLAAARDDESRWNRVHRSALGPLDNLGAARIWARRTCNYSEPESPGRAVITDMDELHEPLPVDVIWEVNPNIDNTIKALPDFARGSVADQTLTVYIPIDFAPPQDQGYIVFEDIRDWVEIVAYRITRQYAHSRGESKLLSTTCGQKCDTVEMRFFDDVRSLAATASRVFFMDVYRQKLVVSTDHLLEATERTISTVDNRTPTLRDRFVSAIAAFRNPSSI